MIPAHATAQPIVSDSFDLSKYKRSSKNDEKQDSSINFFHSSMRPVIAIDNSGSTSGSILSRTKDLIQKITEQKNPSVIAWNSSAKIQNLQTVNSTGGTSPASIFTCISNQKNLLITTDGEICSSEVNKVIPLLEKSEIVNVIAIYIGGRSGAPNTLNLPVFAPFQSVPGLFLLYHFDGTAKLLLKSGNGSLSQVPDLPVVSSSSKWDHFPTVEVTSISKIQVNSNIQKVALNEGELMLNGEFIVNMGYLFNDLKKNPKMALHSSFASFLAEDLVDIAATAKPSEFDLIRSVTNLWQREKLQSIEKEDAHMISGLNSEIEKAEQEINNLIEQIKISNDINLKKRLGELTKAVYYLYERKREIVQQKGSDIARIANMVFQALIKVENASYTLEDLANNANMKSNRARRARAVDQSKISVESLNIENGVITECDICAQEQIQALIGIKITPEQLERNTSDYALDDTLSVGAPNHEFLPSSSLCLYCASFLHANKKPCPYTRQEISCVIPMVKNTSTSYRMIKSILSVWLFDGRDMKVEYQMFLSLLDSVEGRVEENEQGRFPKRVFDHWREFILKNTNANYMGLLGKNKPILEAMADIMRPNVSQHSSQSWLEPLRNKSLTSVCIMSRALLEYDSINTPADKYQGVIFRMLVKSIVSRFLSLCKKSEQDAQLLKKMILRDIYDTRTGFPIINTGRVCSFSQSGFIKKLYGDRLFDVINKELNRFCKSIGTTLEDFVQSLYITAILFNLNKVDKFNIGEEDLLIKLVNSCKEFSDAFFLSKENIDIKKLLASLHAGINNFDSDDHNEIPSYAPCHLISPAITVCGICGVNFTTLIELSSATGDKTQLLEEIKKRRAEHLNKYFKGDKQTGMVTHNSVHISVHQAVSIVMSKYGDEDLPRREMIEDVVRYLRNNIKGNVYKPNTLKSIVCLVWDYIQKKKQGVAGRVELGDNIMTKDRLELEISWVTTNAKLIPPHIATLDGLPDDLVQELLKPIDISV